MEIKYITDDFAVCGQILESDLPDIIAAGFKSIVNNRPDSEEPDQPMNSSMEEAVVEAGLSYGFNPVSPTGLTEENIASMRDHLDQLPKPVLAFCRTGNRCTILFNSCQ